MEHPSNSQYISVHAGLQLSSELGAGHKGWEPLAYRW